MSFDRPGQSWTRGSSRPALSIAGSLQGAAFFVYQFWASLFAASSFFY